MGFNNFGCEIEAFIKKLFIPKKKIHFTHNFDKAQIL